MIELYEFDAGQSCKLWCQELPSSEFVPENIYSDSYAISNLQGVHESGVMMAAEILIPRGGRSLYGLLGFEFSPIGNGTELVSEIGVLDSTQSYTESLAVDIDDVFIGLSAEYYEFVKKGITYQIEKMNNEGKGVSPGTLRNICTAHGEVSSNGPTFEKLTKGILELMFRSDEIPSKSVVAKAFDI